MATATQRRLIDLGLDGDFVLALTPPPNKGGSKYVVHAPAAYNATLPSDDLHDALDAGWSAYKMGEAPALVWDYRGDGADYDPAAEPRIIAVVTVHYLDEA